MLHTKRKTLIAIRRCTVLLGPRSGRCHGLSSRQPQLRRLDRCLTTAPTSTRCGRPQNRRWYNRLSDRLTSVVTTSTPALCKTPRILTGNSPLLPSSRAQKTKRWSYTTSTLLTKRARALPHGPISSHSGRRNTNTCKVPTPTYGSASTDHKKSTCGRNTSRAASMRGSW